MPDPRQVYTRMLQERRAGIVQLERRHRKLGYSKVAALAGVAVVVWLALSNHVISILWVLVPAAALAALSIAHENVLRILERRRRAERYFAKALLRLEGKWQGTGETGDAYLDPSHPYAQDLDLF